MYRAVCVNTPVDRCRCPFFGCLGMNIITPSFYRIVCNNLTKLPVIAEDPVVDVDAVFIGWVIINVEPCLQFW